MAGTFVVLWTQDHCSRLKRAGEEGKPLTALFGGSHQSAPSFSRFGVQPGDAVCPVLVRDGVMHVVARLWVEAFLSIADYWTEFIPLSLEEAALPAWRLPEELWRTRPELGHQLPLGCVDEAVVGRGDVAIRFERPLSPSQLTDLRFQNRKGKERGLKYVEDGRLLKVLTLQGRVYRLNEASAAAFESVLRPTESEGLT